MPSIYLDHAATTPMLAAVADAIREASLRYGANPASQHELGRQARRALETARERIAEFLGAGPDDRLIFTSGGTESNNLALSGLVHPLPPGEGRVRGIPVHGAPSPQPSPAGRGSLLISPLEHPSVARTADHLAADGYTVERLPADPTGVVRLAALADVLRPDTRLVSVMLASNETGVLQPVEQIAAACRERHLPIHTDATQVVGKLPVNFRDLGVDALTFTAHKFHGPVGIGALLLRPSVALAPSLRGGFQQASLRPGTENVALAIGMQVALEAWTREDESARELKNIVTDEADRAMRAGDWRAFRMASSERPDGKPRWFRIHGLRSNFERAILAGDSRAVVIGVDAPRLPHISNIAFVGLDRQALVMAFDLAGVACSTGSACASGSSEPSPALVAMGLPGEQISSSIRFSLGATTTAADIDEAARRILNVVNRLRHA